MVYITIYSISCSIKHGFQLHEDSINCLSAHFSCSRVISDINTMQYYIVTIKYDTVRYDDLKTRHFNVSVSSKILYIIKILTHPLILFLYNII